MATGYPDFEGNKSKIYSAPEWSSVAGEDKNLGTDFTNKTYGTSGTVAYTPAAGKTLYIFLVTAAGFAAAQANADLMQIFRVRVIIGGVAYLAAGGNGGVVVLCSPPLVIPGGTSLSGEWVCFANHAMSGQLYLRGFEI